MKQLSTKGYLSQADLGYIRAIYSELECKGVCLLISEQIEIETRKRWSNSVLDCVSTDWSKVRFFRNGNKQLAVSIP